MKIQLILEINVPDGIGTYEDALEYLQYEIGFGANACSCENPFMLYDKEVPYNVVSYEDCEIKKTMENVDTKE